MNRFVPTATIVLAACSLLVMAGTAPAQVSIQGTYWLPTPSGDAAVGIDGVEGTDIDVEDDLGYDDAEGTPSATILLGHTHQIGASWLALDVSARNTVDRQIRFEDLLFRVNSEVASSLEATVIHGFYRLHLGQEPVSGGITLGGIYVDFSASAQAEQIGSASADVTAGMPIAGVHLRLDPVPYLSLRGAFSGMSWTFDDVEATFLDAEASIALRTPTGLFAAAGYRHILIDAEDSGEPIKVDLTFSGPTLSAGFEW
jgi:hypothetical protein